MSRTPDFSTLGEFLCLEQHEWGHVVRLHDDVLRMAEEPYAIDTFRSFLDHLACRPGTPLAFWGTSRCFSPEQYGALLRELGESDDSVKGRRTSPSPRCGLTMMREENALGGLIRWLRSVKRPTIMVYQGDVVLPFLGVGLACDFRIAASDTTFHNQGRDLDMPPGAGLLYLLPAYIGLGRANNLVIRSEEISAYSALKWGLVDDVIAPSALEETLCAMAAEMSCFSPGTLDTIRQLLNQHLPDFDNFFTAGTQGLDRALRGRPWEKLSR